jgi:tetratricopeptide (TPR) repeat protein
MYSNFKWTAFPFAALMTVTVGLQGAIAASKSPTQAPILMAQAQDQRAEGVRLVKQAMSHYDAKQYAEAIAASQRALQVLQSIGEREGMGWSLWIMGMSQQALEKDRDAIVSFEQAIPIFRALKNTSMEANLSVFAGISYFVTSQYKPAIEKFEQALPLLKAQKDTTKSQALATFSLGAAYLQDGQYSKSVQYSEQAIALYKTMNNKEGEARAQRVLATAKQLLAQAK